jgi:hypothetical protein
VFALLSHPSATLANTHCQKIETLIEADYNKSVADIYLSVSERLITTSKCLDIFSYIRGCEEEACLPTWAPLWIKQRYVYSLLESRIDFRADGDCSSSMSRLLTDCSTLGLRQTEEYVTSCVDEGQLFAMSSALGSVSWLFESGNDHGPRPLESTCHTRTSIPDSMVYHLRSDSGFVYVWDQFKAGLPGQPRAGIVRTLAELLTCGQIHPQCEGAGRKYRHARDFATYWTRNMYGHPDAGLFLLQRSLSGSHRNFRKATEHACEGGVLFCTDAGHLGLGPDTLRVGDETCILKGGKVPYI